MLFQVINRVLSRDGLRRGGTAAVVAAVGWAVGWAAALPADAAEPRVVESGDRVVVVLPAEASPAEAFAGQEMTSFLKQMIDVEVTRDSSASGDVALVIEIGNTPGNRPWRERFPTVVTGPGADSFAVVQQGRRLRLVGGGDRGTLYAVYSWLEHQGCRWFAPGESGQVIPHLESLELHDGERLGVPKNITREIGGDAGPFDPWEYMLWQTRNRLNRSFAMRDGYLQKKYAGHPELATAWSRLGGMERWHWIAHNFAFMFGDLDAWFDKHPEYFALYNGQRVRPGSPGRPGYGGGNLALTNPDVVEYCAEFTSRWFDEHPAGTIVPMWPADGAIKWDESPEAMALGGKNFTAGPEGSMSRRLVTFTNAVARRVAEKHPDRLILLPAYQSYIEPVDDLPIEPNVFVQYCYHADYAHGPLNSPVNADAAERMRRWAEKVPGRFGVWEYFLIGDHLLTEPQPVLLPLVYRVRDTMQFLDSIGSTRYFTQSSTIYQPYNPLLYYALARYTWDPSLDADELIRDYALHAFGPAAGPHVAAFYIRLEQIVQASPWRPQLYPDVAVPSPDVFSEEHVAELEPMLAAAEAVSLDATQQRRLQDLRRAFTYSTTNARTQALAGLSAEQPWRLERGEHTYTMNADAPDVDPRRFDDVVRQALDTGQATAKFERLLFRARKRTEPIVAIENRILRAEVLPGLGGRLVRLTDRRSGFNFMKERPGGDTLDAIGAGYFDYGGYEEYLGKGFAGPGWEMPFDATVWRSLDGSSITLNATHDGLDWKRVYHLPGGETTTLTLATTLTNTTDAPRTVVLRTHPQLDVGPGLGDAQVKIRQADGAWVASSPVDEHDGLTVLPHGAWALLNPATDRAVMHRFDPDAATPYFFVSDDRAYAQMELFGEPQELLPGESTTLTQTLYVGSVEAIESAIAELDSTTWLSLPDVPDPPRAVAPLDGELSATKGVVGRAMKRDRPAEQLTYDGGRLDPQSGTIEMWVRLPDTPPASGLVWLLSVGENNPEWLYLVAEPGKLTFCSKSGKSPYTAADMFYVSLSTAAALFDGQWHHVALAWGQADDSPGMLRIYLDGTLRESRDDLRLGSLFPAERLRLGGSSATRVVENPCAIDEFRLSDRPRSAEQIRASFDAGRAGEVLPADDYTRLKINFDRDATAETNAHKRPAPDAVRHAIEQAR